uniref:Uncharacterized protein n=1 Tax=Glossina austeni TaxID=7395 RepID=A0A1A9VIG0_GLOAU
MPQPVAGGYISLEGSRRPSNGQAIYQSTTEPTGPTSMLESMKRVLGQVVGSTTNAVSHDTDDLLNNTNGRQAIIISSSSIPYRNFNVEVSANKINFAFDQTLPKKRSQSSPGTYGGGMFQSNFLVNASVEKLVAAFMHLQQKDGSRTSSFLVMEWHRIVLMHDIVVCITLACEKCTYRKLWFEEFHSTRIEF